MDILETERLIIRPFSMADLEEAHQLLDVDIEWAGPGRSLEWRRERLQLYVGLASWEDTGCLYGYRAMVQKTTGRIIGICGFHPDYWLPEWKAIFWPQWFASFDHTRDAATGSFELGMGWALSHACRGQGYATESAQALLRHAFRALRAPRVFSITDNDNAPSVRVMQRLGMRIAANPNAGIRYPAVAGIVTNPYKEAE